MAGNPFKRLRGLLVDNAQQIGTIQSANTSKGTSIVVLVGGGEIEASGTGFAVGSRVFIQGARIVSAAPSLPAVEIQV